MHYLGGKSRIATQIASYLNIVLMQTGIKDYHEPFVGAAWVLSQVNAPNRYASDIHQPLITMYQALQAGWIPPDSVSEEEYKAIRALDNPQDPLTAFVGFGCSFGGKYWGGYARCKTGPRNYCLNAKNSLQEKLPYLTGVEFNHCSYASIAPQYGLIYCDPPYADTTGYDSGAFDHDAFWGKVRDWSAHNLVIVSEYVAPNDFVPLLTLNVKTDLKNGNKQHIPRVERLFCYEQSPLLKELMVYV